MKIKINESDIEYRPYKGSGPGGQKRNKTMSCIEAKHIPTGITANSTLKSQHQNRRAARAVLIARVIDHYRKLYTPEREINTERIRTYHEPDNRVIDHASGLQLPYTYVVEKGRLDEMIDARRTAINLLPSSKG